jgi:hypothetical protein
MFRTQARAHDALDSRDGTVKKGPYFNAISFSHYFLNQLGFNQLDEIFFHFQVISERMSVIFNQTYTKPLQDKIDQLEERIKTLKKIRKASRNLEVNCCKISKGTYNPENSVI